MMKTFLRLVLVGLGLGFGLPAVAGGAGTYTVKGNNGEAGTDYSGTVVITQTSKDTFKLAWTINGDRYTGHGIGDARIMAVSFTSDGSAGTALLVDDDAGGYKSIWGFVGENKIGWEVMKPR